MCVLREVQLYTDIYRTRYIGGIAQNTETLKAAGFGDEFGMILFEGKPDPGLPGTAQGGRSG
jgi:hypothetical protein